MVGIMINIYLKAQDECINDSLTSPARVMVKYDGVGVGGKSIKKLSKSCQKVQKFQKSKKFAKAISSEECLPKHQSSVNWI